MLEIILAFFQPYLILLAIFLTFPFILQFINTKYLSCRFKRFTISLFSTLFVLAFWVLSIAFFTESDVSGFLASTNNVQIGSEHQSTVETIHTGSQITSFVIGFVFSSFYLVLVYVTWLVSSLLLKVVRGSNT